MATARPSRPRAIDVARRAGVSIGTVSNVLNHPAKVSPDTVDRVRRAIDELGFIRNANASGLAAGQNRNIGFVVIDLGNSMFVDAGRGAQRVAREAGLNLMLAGCEDDHELQQQNIEFFDEARVAGMLLAPMQDSSPHIRSLAEHGRPTVLANFDPDTRDICAVIVDNEQAGFLAASHLLELGCRRIAFVAGRDTLQPVRERRNGIRRALKDAASDVQYEEISTPDLTQDSGIALAEELLARGPRTRPDGIIAVTDTLAEGLMSRLTAGGVRIPHDIALMGCDHNSTAWGGPVALTTIAMRGYELGEAAMELLLEELTEPDTHAHRRVVLTPYLVPRASTVGRVS